jgi:hypothetical protein
VRTSSATFSVSVSKGLLQITRTFSRLPSRMFDQSRSYWIEFCRASLMNSPRMRARVFCGGSVFALMTSSSLRMRSTAPRRSSR